MLESDATIVCCPYCGENLDISIDTSAGEQSYIEDCQVCCQPIEMRLYYWMDSWQVEVKTGDD